MSAELKHGEAYIRSAILYGFTDLVKSKGGDAIDLMTRANIEPVALTNPNMLISFPRVGVLLALAAAELDMPDLGLEWAMSIPPHFPNVGPIVFLAQMVDSLGEWIEQTLRYWRYHTNGYTLQLLDDGESDTVTLRFWQSPLISSPRQQFELKLASCCHMGRVVTGQPGIGPSVARFRHEKPDNTHTHDRIFQCTLEFGAEHNELVFDRQHLAQPTNGRLKSLKSIFDSFIRYRIRHMPLYNQSVSKTTEIAIQTVLGAGMCSKEFIAESMGTTAARLSRLLAKEGTSFAELQDKTRQATALSMFSETGVPISAIAGLLEYSSTTALNLAMKRWTGMTPSEYRAKAVRLEREPKPGDAAPTSDRY